MTKKVDTWMPLLVDKYLGDTMLLTTEQHGAYLLLLMTMWKQGGKLPNNDAQLAAAAKLPLTRWKAMRPLLVDGALLREEDGFVVQKRLTAELARAKAHTDAKAEAGAKGAAKRWEKDGSGNAGANGKPDGTANGTAIANELQKVSQTGAPIPTPSATQITETANAVSARGAVGMALKAGGIDPTRINLDDPRIASLIAQGATPAEFQGMAKEAVDRGIDKPVGWICTALAARRRDAAAIVLEPAGGQGGMLDDPNPAWALEAGFSNRFEAENEGCTRRTASKFRNGKRVEQ